MEVDEDFGLDAEEPEVLSARQEATIVSKMAQGVSVICYSFYSFCMNLSDLFCTL